MDDRDEVADLLRRWGVFTEARDADGCANLFLRDPAPLVTFSDGERCRSWRDVHARLGRDLARAIVERVEVHHLEVEELADDVLVASYVYDMHLRDVWGTGVVATRLATLSLVRTKDGLRIATAHYSVPPP